MRRTAKLFGCNDIFGMSYFAVLVTTRAETRIVLFEHGFMGDLRVLKYRVAPILILPES